MWPYIIDGALILIILICTIVGIVKGFFDSLLSLLGTGLSFVASVFLAKYVSSFLNKIIGIEDFVLNKLNSIEGNTGSIQFFGTRTNSEVAKFCTWVVTAIVMFLIIKLVIYILSKIFESVVKSSTAISGLNRVLGMLFGLVKGVAYVAVVLGLCSAVSQVPVIGASITDKIAETKLTSFAYKYVDEFVDTKLTQETVNDIIGKLTNSGDQSNSQDEDQTETPESPTDEDIPV